MLFLSQNIIENFLEIENSSANWTTYIISSIFRFHKIGGKKTKKTHNFDCSRVEIIRVVKSFFYLGFKISAVSLRGRGIAVLSRLRFGALFFCQILVATMRLGALFLVRLLV